MNPTFLGLLIFVVFVILVMVVAKLSGGTSVGPDNFKYQKLKVLFTTAKRLFLGVIKLAIKDKAVCLGRLGWRTTKVTKPKSIRLGTSCCVLHVSLLAYPCCSFQLKLNTKLNKLDHELPIIFLNWNSQTSQHLI